MEKISVRMVAKLVEINSNLHADELLYNDDGTSGKICHPCSSALSRLSKLESSTKENIRDAVTVLVNDDQQGSDLLRSARSEPPRSRKRPSVNSSQGGSKVSPDVAVSLLL